MGSRWGKFFPAPARLHLHLVASSTKSCMENCACTRGCELTIELANLSAMSCPKEWEVLRNEGAKSAEFWRGTFTVFSSCRCGNQSAGISRGQARGCRMNGNPNLSSC